MLKEAPLESFNDFICCDFPPLLLRERGHKFDDHQGDILQYGNIYATSKNYPVDFSNKFSNSDQLKAAPIMISISFLAFIFCRNTGSKPNLTHPLRSVTRR